MMRLLTYLCFFFVLDIAAQDYYFSQFWNAPTQTSVAALASIDHLQTGVHYRNQWPSQINTFTTYGFHLSYPLLRQGPPDPQWGALGVEVVNDISGLGGTLNNSLIKGTFNYKIPITYQHYLAMGVSTSAIWSRINTEGLSTGSQFIGGAYLPGSDIGENLNQNFNQKIAIDAGAEFYQRTRRGSKRWTIAASLYNINKTSEGFVHSGNNRPIRMSLSGGFLFIENSYIKVTPRFFFQHQSGSQQTVMGTNVYYKMGDDASKRSNKDIASLIGGGIYSRLGKDIILVAEAKQETFSAGISFDFNANANSTRPTGNVELFLTYNIGIKPKIPKPKPAQKRPRELESTAQQLDSTIHTQKMDTVLVEPVDSADLLLHTALDRDLNSESHYSTMVEFKVLDDSVNVMSIGSEIILKNLEDDKESKFYITYNKDSTAFMSYLKKNTRYSVTIIKEGFYNKTLNFNTGHRDTLEIPSKLKLIVLGEIIVLNKVHFKSGFAVLESSSIPELQSLVNFLIEYPTIKAEISGHTDDAGPSGYNLELSQLRAEVIVNYLIERGIEKDRLTAIGFGETQPLKPNTTAKNRAINRRVELKIIGK